MTQSCSLFTPINLKAGSNFRALLRSSVDTLVGQIWGGRGSATTTSTVPFQASAQFDQFFDRLLELAPENDAQRQMQSRAIQITTDLLYSFAMQTCC
jgi:hypothetical protein